MKPYLLLLIISLPSCAWAQSKAKPHLQKMSAQTMRESSYSAGTKIKDEKAMGGFAPSDNLPRDIGKAKAEQGKISLDAAPNQIVAIGKYRGMRLYLLNTTKNDVSFGALDSRLMMIQEAHDKDGKWKPIESFPRTFCGNSYHHVFLGPGQYWKFDVPRYQGSFVTKLRFRLKEDKSELISNEFEGNINPKQFEKPKKSR